MFEKSQRAFRCPGSKLFLQLTVSREFSWDSGQVPASEWVMAFSPTFWMLVTQHDGQGCPLFRLVLKKNEGWMNGVRRACILLAVLPYLTATRIALTAAKPFLWTAAGSDSAHIYTWLRRGLNMLWHTADPCSYSWLHLRVNVWFKEMASDYREIWGKHKTMQSIATRSVYSQ